MSRFPKNIITEVDDKWHPINEDMPTSTLDVEFRKFNGDIVEGLIEVDMAGWYACERNGNGQLTYTSLDYYKAWRFIPDEDYPGYEHYTKGVQV